MSSSRKCNQKKTELKDLFGIVSKNQKSTCQHSLGALLHLNKTTRLSFGQSTFRLTNVWSILHHAAGQLSQAHQHIDNRIVGKKQKHVGVAMPQSKSRPQLDYNTVTWP